MSVDINLVRSLPIFASASESLLAEVSSRSMLKTIPKGQQIAYEGMSSDWFFVVLSGDIRVYKMSESGKEATLFNISDNESCILTIFSILSQEKFPAFASVNHWADEKSVSYSVSVSTGLPSWS